MVRCCKAAMPRGRAVWSVCAGRVSCRVTDLRDRLYYVVLYIGIDMRVACRREDGKLEREPEPDSR